MASEWFQDFFHGVALDLWRKAVPREQTQAEAKALRKLLDCPPRAEILDVPCGDGRLALELAAAGDRLTGVDISEENIARARDANPEVEWRCDDMRNLPWTERFDGAICVGNSFGYLEHEGTLAFLAALAGALKPGARAVIDAGTAAEALLPNFRERSWYEVDDILFLIENRYHADRSRLETHYTFVRGGAVERRVGFQSVYTAAEIARTLAQNGLAVESLHNEQGDPFTLGNSYLRIVARKEPTAMG